MDLKTEKRSFLTLKLTAAFLLSASLACSTSFAESLPDFSVIQFNSKPKPIKLINPLYLDTSKTEKPVLKIHTTVPYQNLEEFTESDYFSSGIDVEEPKTEIVNDAFTPPVEVKAEEIEPLEIIEDNYYASAQKETLSSDMEGRIISRMLISGLKTLNQDIVVSKISTKEGSLFNSDILQQDLQKIYASGYFTDEMSVEPVLNSDGTVEIVFNLEENILVSDVSIIGNTVISTLELTPLVSPLKRLPQNIIKINETVDKVNKYYHDKGYILASVVDVSDDSKGALEFSINEGVINKIEIEGNERTRDYVIERNIMTLPGTVYNENFLKEDLARIYSTQIFSEVDRKIVPSDVVEGEYNVKVVVTEGSTNSVSLGGGIDSGIGLFGSVGYKEDNFMGKGQKLSLSGLVGSGILLSDTSIKNRMNYQAELSFFEPHFINADNSLMSKLYFRDLGSYQVPLAIERRFGGRVGIEHKIKSYDNLTANMSVGLENISLKEGDFNKISSMYAKRGFNIKDRAKELNDGFFVYLEPAIKYSTLDSLENPRNGVVANAKFIEAISFTNSDNTNGRLAGGVTKYFPVRKKSSFSLTARGGFKAHGDNMPEVMAFRLGGPYSVRGYRMNGVGMGEGFLMGSAELATPLPFVDRFKYDFLKKIRITFFMDAGRVFDETIGSALYDRPLSAISMGVGLKVYIPGVGPVSVDYGLPLTNVGEYGSKNGYFTFSTGDIYGW